MVKGPGRAGSPRMMAIRVPGGSEAGPGPHRTVAFCACAVAALAHSSAASTDEQMRWITWPPSGLRAVPRSRLRLLPRIVGGVHVGDEERSISREGDQRSAL